MRIKNALKLVAALVVSALAGTIGGMVTEPAITSGWYDGLAKSALNPPSWVFGPAWSSLYALIGIALFLAWKNDWKTANPVFDFKKKAWNRWSERLWRGDLQKANAIAVFGTQYVLNILWSYLFFGLQMPLLAFFGLIALWFAIVYTIVNFYRISKWAAWLLVPYLLWVSFAGYLNFTVWFLNP